MIRIGKQDRVLYEREARTALRRTQQCRSFAGKRCVRQSDERAKTSRRMPAPDNHGQCRAEYHRLGNTHRHFLLVHTVLFSTSYSSLSTKSYTTIRRHPPHLTSIALPHPSATYTFIQGQSDDEELSIDSSMVFASAFPCSAALRYHFTASISSFSTSSPLAYSMPRKNCASARPCSAALRTQALTTPPLFSPHRQ